MLASALETLIWQKLNDPGGTYAPDALGALNEGQRLFALLSLCLEKTVAFPLTAGTLAYNLLGPAANSLFADLLVVRRVYNSEGRQLRPATIAELQALDANWQATPGVPARYVVRGLDWLAVYPQPPAADALLIVYACCPVPLAAASTPQIRSASQYALVNYGACALRTPEGGQEQEKFKGYFAEFLAEAQRTGELVRMRNRDSGFETTMAFELERVK
jgi:hypothetical protein